MIIYDHPQGSEEWLRARAGKITASMFKVARERVGGLTAQQSSYVYAIRSGFDQATALKIAGYKKAPTSETISRALSGEKVGTFSEAAKNYAFKVAVESISGLPMDEGFQSWQMRRGQELEPEARDAYERRSGNLVELASFVTTDCKTFGCSADGLIGDDGGLEIKCLVSPEAIREAILDHDISPWYDQVQGGMWITGRDWWDFVIYCPALAGVNRELTIWKCERDHAYIDALEADLNEFVELVNSYIKKLGG